MKARLKQSDGKNKLYCEIIIAMCYTKTYNPKYKKRKTSIKTNIPCLLPQYVFRFHSSKSNFKRWKINIKTTKIFKNGKTPSFVSNPGSTTLMKLVNYKIAVNNIDDLETFGTGLRVFHCKESSFGKTDHGHIITGNLRFTENKRLRS